MTNVFFILIPILFTFMAGMLVSIFIIKMKLKAVENKV